MKGVFNWLACCFLLLVTHQSARGQRGGNSADKDVSPASLSRQLTEKYSQERDKVTAIFQWITDNIAYNTLAIIKSRNRIPIFEEPEDTSPVLKPLTERVAETVLRRKTAICDGYARLFKSLCDHAGIRSEVITGYARVGWGRQSRFRSNHKWNAVMIDSAWYLLDATWAAGIISSRGDEFIKAYNNRYFLTPPGQFISDHYPEDLVWSLLEKPPALSEFSRMPFHYNAFIQEKIVSYSPERGVIEAAPGDTIRFEVISSGENILLHVTDEPLPPSLEDYSYPLPKGESPRATCNYIVIANSPGWLYLICNGETILRYRLNTTGSDSRTAGRPDR